MKHFPHAFGYFVAAALLGLAIVPNPASAQQAQQAQAPARAAATPPGNAENGKRAFMAHTCYSCHGYSAEGGVGARLVGYRSTIEAFTSYVRKPAGAMPPAGAKISAQELADIYTWVRSLPPSPDAKTIDLLKP
jgi:mono/diheme cytochrome c family protein